MGVSTEGVGILSVGVGLGDGASVGVGGTDVGCPVVGVGIAAGDVTAVAVGVAVCVVVDVGRTGSAMGGSGLCDVTHACSTASMASMYPTRQVNPLTFLL